MKGISSSTQKTITMDQKAIVSMATGQKVGSEFIAETLKYSRFVRRPTNTKRKVWGTRAAETDSDRRFEFYLVQEQGRARKMRTVKDRKMVDLLFNITKST